MMKLPTLDNQQGHMLRSGFKRIVESHFRTQDCPGCGALVHLEQERCPRCEFDLASWRWNWFIGMMKAFTEGTEDVKEASTMETYNAVIKMHREHPHYIPLLEKCVATCHRKEKDMYFEGLGFESKDVPCKGTALSNLFRDYPEVVNRVYSSRSSKGYVIVNISEVERALGDIKSRKIAGGTENDIFMRIRLSSSTVKRLREYAASEFPGWDDSMAVWLVVERAINDFLDRA